MKFAVSVTMRYHHTKGFVVRWIRSHRRGEEGDGKTVKWYTGYEAEQILLEDVLRDRRRDFE